MCCEYEELLQKIGGNIVHFCNNRRDMIFVTQLEWNFLTSMFQQNINKLKYSDYLKVYAMCFLSKVSQNISI